MNRALAPVLAAVLLLAGPAASRAAESAAVTTARTTATLMTDTDSVAPGAPFRAALRLRLKPGWHTYWKNPGDAGLPPQLAFDLPKGASASPIAWPLPERQAEGPLTTYGYQGEVVLPVTVTPAPGDGFDLAAQAQWLVCKDICVPEEGRFRLHLPPGTPARSAQTPLFNAADSRTPRPAPWASTIAADGALEVAGAELTPETVAAAWFIPDEPDAVSARAPQRLSVRRGGLRLQLALAQDRKPGTPLPGVLVLRDTLGQSSGYLLDAQPGAVAAEGPGWAQALALALLGGLVLNLMPCVFPVLAMKALALARLSGAERRHARVHALSYTAGVLVTFAALGSSLLVLRAGGAAAGWGFQFQSPLFVVAMAALMAAIGFNLAGVFAVGAGRSGTGQMLAARGGHAGSFFTGLLAVLVATPCTAPFMAAALGAAVAAPAALAMGIFVALGVGLAAPYLLLAAFPALIALLPRPGRWMERVRQILAIPMFATAAWLLWVLATGWGVPALLAGLGIVGAVAASTLAIGRTQRGHDRRVPYGALALSVLALMTAAKSVAFAPPPAVAVESGAETFTTARLAALRAEGRPVFVNMTAAWCVTCLVNERVALAPASVRSAFAAGNVAYLKGDWTRQDADVSAYLRAQGRDGVPLYVFYPPNGAEPVVLPQILTAGTVLETVGAARG